MSHCKTNGKAHAFFFFLQRAEFSKVKIVESAELARREHAERGTQSLPNTKTEDPAVKQTTWESPHSSCYGGENEQILHITTMLEGGAGPSVTINCYFS